MNKELLQTWLRDPRKLDGNSHKELKALIDKYPYYQAPYLLLLKTLNQQKSIRFNQELKNSALFIPDRRRLYLYINDKLEFPTYKAEPILNIPVKVEFESKEENETFTLDDKGTDALISSSLHADISESDESEENLVEAKGKVINFDDLEINISNDVEEEIIVENKTYVPESEIYDMNFGGSLYVLNSDDDVLESKENHSFSDWMSKLASPDVKSVQITDENKEKKSAKKQKLNMNSDLISDFIENKPRIPKPNEKSDNQADVPSKSLKEDVACISETLARIYIKQKLFDKAKVVYEKLMLKNPEKNIYFASQLERIEKFKNR
ncbi:hypothetical protein [Ancylomarina sp. 16SWW S1-10-2]|uniref:hypothetical protein n=1 Tax=Ancylomarina sp. 16SWW S1-10-2 TaxID=2499681 RepID=UPI0012AE9FFC|nr:hypothetical protein [Ancylomarina sp. 16SWW S1-10-2]MRT94745.1 hypothetical protein [Ancylomarina sp. 16SWW S1-10-2]